MTATQSRNHYRSSSYFLPDDETLGAAEFTPILTLPHRRSASVSTPTSSKHKFRIHNDDPSLSTDDTDSSEDGRDPDNNRRRQENLARYNKFLGKAQDTEGSVKVPFPGSPPVIHTTPSSPSPPLPPRVQRPPSSATRPSLKSASSSPEILTLRSLSSHSTPASSSYFPLQEPRPPSPTTAKRPSRPSLKSASSTPEIPTLRTLPSHHVHFRDDAHIATVRLYDPTGRPRSVSGGCIEDTETENEGDLSTFGAWNGLSPFVPPKPSPSPTLDLLSSPIPADPPQTLPFPPDILLTSLSLKVHPRTVTLHGALLVLNRIYEKYVTVRFTLDDWATVSEVQAGWKGEGILPSGWANKLTFTTRLPPPAYDTFTFQIQLPYHQHYDLCVRTLYLCARFSDPMGGEWWDNNGKKNYWVKFVERTSSQRPKLAMGRSYSSPSSTADSEAGLVGLPTLKGIRNGYRW